MLKVVQTFEEVQNKLGSKIEEVKKENNKKIVTLINEVEKLQQSLDRKCNLDEFNVRLDTKVDKSQLSLALGSRPTR